MGTDRHAELARAHRRRKTRRHLSLLLLWARQRMRRRRPVDEPDLAPVERGQVAITRAGHATVLIRYPDLAVLCDPLLGRRCGGAPRLEAQALPSEAVASVDLILISADEPDHLDRASLAALPDSATVVVPSGAARKIEGLGFDRVVELTAGSGFGLSGVDVIATPARAERPALTYVLSGDGPKTFFCGSSGYFDGFAAIGRAHRPDLALLPIGGYVPASFRHRHLSPLDAVTAFEDLLARVLIPHRYRTFALSYERMDEPERWLLELVAERELERYIMMMQTGETRLFRPPREPAASRGPTLETEWVDVPLDFDELDEVDDFDHFGALGEGTGAGAGPGVDSDDSVTIVGWPAS